VESLFNSEEQEIVDLNQIMVQIKQLSTKVDGLGATIIGLANVAQTAAVLAIEHIEAELTLIQETVNQIVTIVGKPGPAVSADFIFGKPVAQASALAPTGTPINPLT
jgi:hypothetical protein